jgi:hypothetical protein
VPCDATVVARGSPLSAHVRLNVLFGHLFQSPDNRPLCLPRRSLPTPLLHPADATGHYSLLANQALAVVSRGNGRGFDITLPCHARERDGAQFTRHSPVLQTTSSHTEWPQVRLHHVEPQPLDDLSQAAFHRSTQPLRISPAWTVDSCSPRWRCYN